ncbi:MAG TPA: hypothetical protein VJP02_17865 [Candidatus Sulfotelmatobacter sp.]|nr:hypothetical protein [Candidatus Sulfotelmatobacter sp.]
MSDLLQEPWAVKPETRAEYLLRMQATPKKSTTSRCTTGDGGITPVRTQDAKERRAAIDAVVNSPQNQLQARWDAAEKRWAEMDARYEKEKQDKNRASEERERRTTAVRDLEAQVDKVAEKSPVGMPDWRGSIAKKSEDI